jgi:tRNA(Ile)-lysidine synthase
MQNTRGSGRRSRPTIRTSRTLLVIPGSRGENAAVTPEAAICASLDRLPPGAGVLVAVSGGADSVALLNLLVEAAGRMDSPPTLFAAHLDHGLRGEESRQDARFVREISRRLRVRCLRARVDLRRRHDHPTEADARRIRYRFLLRAAGRVEATVVHTGHTLDDQAETVLDRMLRGAGIRGLRGILPDRALGRRSGIRLQRPLLGVRRGALRTWLKQRGIPWREDPTNHDGSNRRSQIRLGLLPDVESIRPGGIDALARIADRARETWSLIKVQTVRHARRAIRTEGGAIVLSREALRRAPRAIRWPLLDRALRAAGQTPRGLGEAAILEALRIAMHGSSGTRFERPGHVAFIVDRTSLRPY